MNLYEKTIEIDPNFSKSYLMIAFIHLKASRIESARKFAKECFLKDSHNILAEYIIAASEEDKEIAKNKL